MSKYTTKNSDKNQSEIYVQTTCASLEHVENVFKVYKKIGAAYTNNPL